MAPPYCAPYMTPASIRMAPTGLMPKVSGSRIEIVASGPMPGSTPTMLPISTPMKHHIRFCGSSATPKPYQRSVSAVVIISTLHSNNGIGTFSTYENSATPKTVTTVARTSDPFHVAVRSPRADTNTQAKVAGMSPK